MIILFRANGITASRVNKYVDYYKSQELDYRIVGWDRLGEKITLPNYDFFNYRTKYVQGGIKAVLAKLRWIRFVYKYLKNIKKEVTTVHACDLDVAFPSVLFKIIHKRELNIIFDVCDWNSASKGDGIVIKCLRVMERFTVKHCNEMIICEPERINQIQFKVPIPVHVMRNIPSFDNTSFLDEEVVKPFDNENVTVAYVGWFGHGRFIEELLNYAETGKINLLIAGFGMAQLEEHAKKLNDTMDNVRFFGKVDYKFGLQILKASDLVYAMYCKSIPNHFYAAPNKFYESMFLGKAILSTKGIPLEEKIKKYGTGYVIEETMQDLANFLGNASKEKLSKKGEEARTQWPYFSQLTEQFMKDEYSKMIK